MIKCPFCASVYPEGTLFCEECGSYLTSSDEQATESLGEQASEQAGPGTIGSSSFTTLVLSIESGGRIELPLSKEVTLGRLDAGRAVFPDVDLTGEDGLERGVSRRAFCHSRGRAGRQRFQRKNRGRHVG